jgi:hypothetical protein
MEQLRQQYGDIEEPLELMLTIMRDPVVDFRVRLEAAKAAAPYRHARLNSIEHKGNAGVTITISPDDAALL